MDVPNVRRQEYQLVSEPMHLLEKPANTLSDRRY
jgi:hypothetical protein